jgi:hypothetical protein
MPLAIDDIVAEAMSDSDTPVTTAGAASVWYVDKNRDGVVYLATALLRVCERASCGDPSPTLAS